MVGQRLDTIDRVLEVGPQPDGQGFESTPYFSSRRLTEDIINLKGGEKKPKLMSTIHRMNLKGLADCLHSLGLLDNSVDNVADELFLQYCSQSCCSLDLQRKI